jgi:hypothetical protein
MNFSTRAGFVIAAAAVCAVATAAPPKKQSATAMGVEVEVGKVSYEEDVSIRPVDSEWEASYIGLSGHAQVQYPQGLVLRGRMGAWGSGEDTEKWSEEGTLVQRNDMDIWGLEVGGDIGVAIHPSAKVRVMPFAGLGYRAQRFERSRFEFIPPDPAQSEIGRVTEDFDILFIRVGAELEVQASDKLGFYLRGSVGEALTYEADNSAFDEEISGDGGRIVQAAAGITYRLNRQQRIGAGIRYDMQDMEGDVELIQFQDLLAQLELPDNELERVAAEVTWQIDL